MCYTLQIQLTLKLTEHWWIKNIAKTNVRWFYKGLSRIGVESYVFFHCRFELSIKHYQLTHWKVCSNLGLKVSKTSLSSLFSVAHSFRRSQNGVGGVVPFKQSTQSDLFSLSQFAVRSRQVLRDHVKLRETAIVNLLGSHAHLHSDGICWESAEEPR